MWGRRTTLLAMLVVMAALSTAIAEVTDDRIRAEVRRRLGAEIAVSVRNGTVSLTGTVATLSRRMNAVNLARRTLGVRGVSDGIRVVPAQKVGDEELSRSARTCISGALSQPEAGAISLGVHDGVVTLTGFLPYCHAKQVAAMCVSVIPGVVDLVNEIVVRPPKHRSDEDIFADVTARFSRNPLIPADRIRLSVVNGVVSLMGTVSSFLQADQAESSACFVPGVVGVRNELFVSGE